MEGHDPVTARRNASEVLEGKAADVDDTTLQRWLLEEFNLEKAPANAEQWKNAIAQEIPFQALAAIDQLYRRLHLWTESRETPP
jgi:hypothetical protein